MLILWFKWVDLGYMYIIIRIDSMLGVCYRNDGLCARHSCGKGGYVSSAGALLQINFPM